MSTDVPAAGAEAIRRLTDVSRALTYAASLDEVLDLSVACAADLLDASQAILALHDEDEVLRIRASRGVPERAVARFGERLDETLAARLESVFGPGAATRFLGVPLVVRGRIIGLLAVNPGGEATSVEEGEWLLSALADQTSTALEAASGTRLRSALEEQVRVLEANRAQTQQAVRIASHDLRTPLSAMQGYLAMLSGGIYGPLADAQVEVLERIQAIGRHIGSVLETVLEFARVSAGEQRVLTSHVSTAEVIRETIAVIGVAATEKGVEVDVDAASAPPVEGDPARLRQVLIHLLDNAVKYSPPHGTVRVSTAVEEHGDRAMVVISVADQGPGIPAEHAEDVFLPSRRLVAEGQDDPGGTGFGLAIARILVEHMEGTVSLDPSASPGATFRVCLPLARPPVTDDQAP